MSGTSDLSPITLSDHTAARKPAVPTGIGSKFTADGRALIYRGNTILSRLPAAHPLYGWVSDFLDSLRANPVAAKLAVLPASSMHMTILGIANDAMRSPGPWPADLAMDASMDDCDAFVRRRLGQFPGIEQLHFDMRLGDLVIDNAALGFHLIPRTAETEAQMRALRNDLASHFQVRRPGHDGFQFHLGIAYLRDWLTPDDQQALARILASAVERLTPQAATIRFPTPELCSFQTMLEYRTLA
ncbi:DUF1868 domain-containing protein [Paracoccus pacificus]|uniref:DUF1868 domain-containing protein n=1 Tax=Paracoccus pacificus TaxID=1463598 RepID=A0ABW4R6D3_9RHOB